MGPRHAYLDESGNTAPFQPSERFLVIAVLTASHSAIRAVELHLKRMRRAHRVRASELKAKEASPRVRRELLQAVAGEDICIVAVIVDKQGAVREPPDPEMWYREAVSRAAQRCALLWPQLRLVLDKRYTKEALRRKLELTILACLGQLAGGVTIEQLSSYLTPGLQIADYVAWAIRVKYESGDATYYDLIRARILVEDVMGVE